MNSATSIDTVTVERGDLLETKEGVGSVTHGDAWSAPIEAQGVITRRHDEGTVVRPGESLIWIANQPVQLASGETPMYRTLAYQRVGNKLMEGDDVRQLQEFLVGKGFDDEGRLEPDGVFGISTKRAVEAWQKDSGRAETGRVDRSQLVFSPRALRIESTPRVGATFADLSVTVAAQVITASFDTKSAGFLEEGAAVEIDLGTAETVAGTITEVTSKVGDDGTRRLHVEIAPANPIAAGIDRVTITVTKQAATNALTIPVRAIVALAGGGYAVEVDGPGGPHLTRIDLGAVVDDRAEISGDINEGDRVVVPTDVIGGGS